MSFTQRRKAATGKKGWVNFASQRLGGKYIRSLRQKSITQRRKAATGKKGWVNFASQRLGEKY